MAGAEIGAIVSALEAKLSVTPWTKEQYDLFRSLHHVLEKYISDAKRYQICVKDREGLSNSLHSYKWYNECRTKADFKSIVDGMSVVEQERSDKHFKLSINFPRHGGFFLKVKYVHDGDMLQYRVYVEDSTHELTGYFAKYKMGEIKADGSPTSYPDFDSINAIIPAKLRRAPQIEVVRFIATIVDFYDIDKCMIGLPLAPDNTMTLHAFFTI